MAMISNKALKEQANPVLQKYRLLLNTNKEFSTVDFRADFDSTMGCINSKQSDRTLSDIWNLTKDPVLLYFFDQLEPKLVEYQFFVARGYGLKKYDDPNLAKSREYFWRDYHATTRFPAVTNPFVEPPLRSSDEPFELRTVNGKAIKPK